LIVELEERLGCDYEGEWHGCDGEGARHGECCLESALRVGRVGGRVSPAQLAEGSGGDGDCFCPQHGD
jgi:hypothetical protein